MLTEGIPLKVSRDSAPYHDVLDALSRTTPKIGGEKGVIDRLDVADSFLARTTGSAPTFVTADERVIRGLVELSSEVAATKAAKKGTARAVDKIGLPAFLVENHAKGFTARVTDSAGTVHELLVIPAIP
jgi:hypothetical protein